MSIKVKAVERNVSFDKNSEKWAYVMQADLYSKLTSTKVIQEAALRSGISKGAINAAWDAIGEVIKAWATEGHSVAVPGLGTMRFGIRSTSVDDVNNVSSKFITARRVIFTPNADIKSELASTAISITCYDRNGNVIKQVTSKDSGEVEDDENGTQAKAKYTITLGTSDEAAGLVQIGDDAASASPSKQLTEGTEVKIKAVAKSGYKFVMWTDGDENVERTITLSKDTSLSAEFSQA